MKMTLNDFARLYMFHVKKEDRGKESGVRCSYCGSVVYENGEFFDCCKRMKEEVCITEKSYAERIKHEEELERVEKGANFGNNLNHSCLEGFERAVNFKSFKTECKEQVKNKEIAHKFCKNNKVFMILYGNVGTGKTHLAVATMKYIAYFGNMDFSILRCSQIYAKDEIEKHSNTGVCVIDDIGRETGSDARLSSRVAFISEVIENRARKKLKTIITTNLSVEEIKDKYGAHIIDRILESVQLCEPMKFESMRGKTK